MVEIAVAPKTAYPEEYAPFTVMTAQDHIQHEHLNCAEKQISRTFAHIPSQMSQPIERVESEWQCNKRLPSVLDSVWKSSNEIYYVGAVKGPGCNEVGEGEPVQHWKTPVINSEGK